MNILLTGATGFLGSHLLENLLNYNHNVIILKRSTSNIWRIKHLIKLVKSYDVDINSLENVFSEHQIDCVIHTACHFGRNHEPINEIVDTNLMFGLRLLDVCLNYKVKTFINTDTLLQKQLNIYTFSKKQIVDWLFYLSDRIQVINLKIEYIYGLNDNENKFVPWLLSQFQQNISEIKLTLGEQKRDFIYVDDVTSAYLIIINNLFKFGSYNEFEVGTGQLTTLKTFVELIKDYHVLKFGNINTFINFGALPYRKGEAMEMKVNNQPLRHLGWEPKINIQQGILKLLG